MRLFALLLLPALLLAGDLRPLRTSAPPVIDGKLDDIVWSTAPSVSEFVTFAPDFGKQQAQMTRAWMAYDPENLYFAWRCWDDPQKIKSSVSARDQIRSDDWVCLNIDTYGDQQGLTALYVNPAGIQMDSRFAGTTEDFSIDMVWYSAGQMLSDGYTVEMQVPLKSIRYADRDTAVMTVFFERFISRFNEHGSFPPMDPKKGMAFLTQMAPMYYPGLTHPTLLEILPAWTFNQQYRQTAGDLRTHLVRREGSLTLKYGVTSDLILDATYNPDFSQVEADAGQVDINLRSPLFFAEKRPFFLEGREHFNVGASGPNFQTPFYSRAIADPTVGTRLTGKIGERNTVGLLFANDNQVPPGGSTANDVQFGILRYKRALGEDSYVGAFGGAKESDGYNRIGGLDGLIRVGQGRQFGFAGFASTSKAPGAPRTTGHALTTSYSLSNRDHAYSVVVENVSPDFRADMGFINRTGVTYVSSQYVSYLYPRSTFWNRIAVGINPTATYDNPSRLWESSVAAITNVIFRGNLALQVRAVASTEIFRSQRFTTSVVSVQGGGQFTRDLGVTLIGRVGDAIYYSASPFSGRSRRAQAIITYQPSNQIKAEYQITYQDLVSHVDRSRIFEYPINRLKLTYQVDAHLFFRGIGETNGFRKTVLGDFLASFTYIPGTVIHLGYGSLYEQTEWDAPTGQYRPSGNFLETNRGFFFKASYLWRL